jgi:hypothetical protein
MKQAMIITMALACGLAMVQGQGFPGKALPQAPAPAPAPAVASAAEPAAAPVAALPDLTGKVKVMMCSASHTKGWQAQIKNLTKERVVIEVVGISLRDTRDLEIGRAGARNVVLEPGQTIHHSGKFDTAKSIEWAKFYKAEVILNPKDPDSYLK